MSRAVITYRPSYVGGGLIALAGLILAWLLPGFLPAWMSDLVAGPLTGGFGVAAASRLWPGLPLTQMIQYGPAVALYGVVIGLIAGN
ncbi:hypothetical protein JHW45_14395 [Paracoccus stylophorae]|uniref:Uncharacterized protein n=1 Tax=Paracoccus stylophorae TaxID=659350 RepID=A0ABY7ST78_9RHOB|nr:hypothetical protein [Paracoccus stylophorae]WCR10245.1 hypothetical protein JHW45_14395 [Paracoccus stylophorae]